MFNHINYTSIFFSLLLLILLSGCKKSETFSGIRNNSKVTIKAANSLYLCADKHQGNQIMADRVKAGEWEKFKIAFLPNNTFTLKAYNETYIGVSKERENLLFFGYAEGDSQTIFQLKKIDSEGFVIQDYRNNYIGFDTTGNILIANKQSIEEASIFLFQQVPKKQFSYFSTGQLVPLILGIILIFISLIAFQYMERKRVSIFLLLLGSFFVRLFMILLDSHLNMWDEQFHALVARNLIDNPLFPALYKNPVLPYDETSWVAGHIWLHKQPLFLWQMALSMKFFGINTLAMRLPSILMSTLVVYFIYRIGSLTINKTAAFFGAVFFALANFTLEISAGAIHTDHNDVAFLFYVSASVWAWVEYENSILLKRKYLFLLLIGLFVGCAILVKWLTGLLVFSGWGLSILFFKERCNDLTKYGHLLVSLVTAIIIFLPWQIYINTVFPTISQHELALNNKHFFEVVEDHSGDFWWHFNVVEELYGLGIFFILACVIILFVSLKSKVYKTAFLTYILIIYLFFGIAATKMIAFTFCVSFLIYLAFGATLDKFFKIIILNPIYLPRKIHHVSFLTLVISILLVLNLDIEKIQERHTIWKKSENSYFAKMLEINPIIKNLSNKIEHIEDYVIFNCKSYDNISVMFFNDVVAAYSLVPEYNTYLSLKQKGYKIAIFDNGKLPPFLVNDTEVLT